MGSHTGLLCSKLSALCSMIKQASAYGKWREVLSNYSEMQKYGHQLHELSIFPIVLKACAKLSWSFLGRSIHAGLIKKGLESSVSVGNSIADFYLKCGDLYSAMREFNSMSCRDSVSWNIILFGLLDRGYADEGLQWFRKSRVLGFEANISTLVLVIQACRSPGRYCDGEKLHGYVIRNGFYPISSVQNSILCMYAEFDMPSAQKVFDEMSERDVISWSVMIRSYVQNQEALLGMKLFQKMVREAGTEPDGIMVTTVLKACAVLGDIELGKSVHGFVIRRGLSSVDEFVGNSVIDMYCKSGDVDSAFRVFNEMMDKNIVSWNSILSGFVRSERYHEALKLFGLMGEEAIDIDEVTLVSLLQVCKFLEEPLHCKSIHCMIIRRGYETKEVAMSCLIDAYTGCNLIDHAKITFDAMPCKDVVSWTTMISGFARSGRPDEAMSTFYQMNEKPNSVTIINLLDACSVSADLRKTKWAHGISLRRGLAADVAVMTAIVDAYAKCGTIDTSKRVFDQIPNRNVVSWTALISAYAMNGLPDEALSSFEEMKQQGCMPNSVTYLAVLSACNHSGLIIKGLEIFGSMFGDHVQLKPSLQHYSCVIDMLSRTGEVETALKLIKNLPEHVKVGVSAWGAVLSGSRSYGKSVITSEVVTEVLELEPSCSSGYLLASNSFAAEKLWKNVAMMRRLVKERRVRVVAGYSMVRVGNTARRFLAGEMLKQGECGLNGVVLGLHSCMKIDETRG